MRKSLIILVLTLLMVLGTSCKNYKETNKIIYEEPSIITNATVSAEDENHDLILTDKVVIQLFLNYNSLDAYNPCVSNFDAYTKEAANYYYPKNKAIFDQLGFSGYESYYISKYLPIIEFEYKKSNFMASNATVTRQINTNNLIKCAYVKEVGTSTSPVEGCLVSSVSKSEMNMATEYANRTVTGDGVKVGVYEAGLVNKNDSAFSNASITVKRVFFNMYVAEHTTLMAKFIAGNEGIAPDVDLYSAYLDETMAGELDWFVDKGVRLINMSCGEKANLGTYSSVSATIDSYAFQYKILFVVSAGNLGNEDVEYVSNPGLAYNVLTVGSSTEEKEKAPHSSFVEEEGPAKPTIVAPGYSIGFPSGTDSYSGTSIATALTTGAIACLLEKHPDLFEEPQKLISLAVASAERFEVNEIYHLDNGFSDRIGAGEFDYTEFSKSVRFCTAVNNTTGKSCDTIITKYINLFGGQKVDISAAWFVPSDGSLLVTQATDYDIYVYNIHTNSLVGQILSTENVENLHIVNATDESMSLRIELKQLGDIRSATGDRVALTYHYSWIDDTIEH